MYKLILVFFSITIFTMCSPKNTVSSSSNHKHTNHLIHESSPYLLQHAHNPVDWYPWGDEALKKAKDENKMLIISIGYAACHWCHVMEHESFEDTTVAKLMNDNFVCIKVDREERPDIDNIYMTACQLITGRGGWPLNALALSDGRPFYAGTYFQNDQWQKVLNHFVDLKASDPSKLSSSAEQITNGVKNQENIGLFEGDKTYNQEKLDKIANNFLSQIDFKRGGRNGSPKFPMPNNYEFLLKYHHITKSDAAKEAVMTTLDNMAAGGIYDHVGGGFARYSTDKDWFAPHFEKMLYDNGQLVSLYAHAYQLTGNKSYKKVVEETLEFVERELMDKNGGFYSSLDADSEGEEGKFYVWTESELDSIINNPEKSRIYKKLYNVKSSGNWEHKNNILNYSGNNISDIAKKYDLEESALTTLVSEINSKILLARKSRIRPGLDDKILTSWNALMIKGYTDAYAAIGNKHYLKIAIKNANFIIKEQLQKDYRLNRNFKDGNSVINAFLDDYGLVIDAFIGLYQATFDIKWLEEADNLMKYVITHFKNDNNGMFNYTSDIDPPLIANKTELTDNVIPGSNSIIARDLFTLGTILDNKSYTEYSDQMLKNISHRIENTEQPSFYSNWCQLYLDKVKTPYEIAILGDNFEEKRASIASHYLGNSILMGGNTEGNLALLKDKLIEKETRIYVCQNKTCKFPVTEVDKALELMK